MIRLKCLNPNLSLTRRLLCPNSLSEPAMPHQALLKVEGMKLRKPRHVINFAAVWSVPTLGDGEARRFLVFLLNLS